MTKIKWNFTTMSWEGLTREQIELWERLYERVDVIQVLKVDMPRWFDRQVTNGKVKQIARKKDWKKFITNWLRKEDQAL